MRVKGREDIFVNKHKLQTYRGARGQSEHIHSSINGGVVFIFMHSFMLNTKGRLKGGQVFVY